MEVYSFDCFLFSVPRLSFVCRLAKIKEWVDANDPGALLIPLSCALELKLSEMQSDEEREAYLKEVGTTRFV